MITQLKIKIFLADEDDECLLMLLFMSSKYCCVLIIPHLHAVLHNFTMKHINSPSSKEYCTFEKNKARKNETTQTHIGFATVNVGHVHRYPQYYGRRFNRKYRNSRTEEL